MTLRELIQQYRDKQITKNENKMTDLIRNYNKNLKEIQKEIESIYGWYTLDGELSISKANRLKALADIEKQLITISKDLGIQEETTVKKALEEATKEAIKTAAYCVEIGINVSTSLAILNDTVTKSILTKTIDGKTFSDRIWLNKEKLVARLNRDIDKALIQGWDIRKISKQISRDFGVSKYESMRLIQSETARVMSEAHEEYYKENKEIIPKMRYVVTLDDKTSNICQALEGEYETGQCPIPVLDSHPKCRCVTVGVVSDWTPKWRLDNETKEVIPDVSYKEWQKLRSKDL